MNGRVRLLESHVVDQIAAGEVVERPASVLKELVENALDAGATAIDIALDDGGRGLVRVADDGCGMDREDAMMALERHATSKIRTFDDLVRARTLGFRGEALPSIAAVSRFELVTRTREQTIGTKIRVDAGKLLDVRDVGAAPGTVVQVRDLFCALPARKAFLRSAPTEASHCVETVTRLALSRPDVAFTVRSDHRDGLFAPATADLAERANALLGEQAWIRIDEPGEGITLRGLAAPPDVQRASATGASYLYIDGRWVRDLVLRRAIQQAYRDLVPQGRYPVVILSVGLPAGSVDVNVHPTKAEVRYRDPAGVAAFVAERLRARLEGAPRGPMARARLSLDAALPALPFVAEAAPVVRPPPEPTVEPAHWEAPPETIPRSAPPPPEMTHREAPESHRAVPAGPAPAVPATTEASWRATVRERYWIVEEEDEIVVIDAGRLARRVAVYEQAGPPRRLLVPVRIPVPSSVVRLVEARAGDLDALGLVVAKFSATELVVRAVPPGVADADPAEVVRAALAADQDVRAAWAERLPPAEIPADLGARARALGLPLGPRVGAVRLA